MKTFLLVFFSTITYIILSVTTISAQPRIESENYRIQFPNLNSGAGIPTSANYKVNSTLGQNAPGLYSSTGFRTKAGFQYIHSIIPFSFSINEIQVNFGTLSFDTPVTHASTIVVSSGGASGYSVKASENNPLTSGVNEVIDTLCDTTCSETTAGVWASTTKYGFGFNMSGDDIPTDFTNSTYFRQFSDRSNSEAEATIMSSSNVGRSRTATITYKINIGNQQPAGTYQNVIKFTAIPSY